MVECFEQTIGWASFEGQQRRYQPLIWMDARTFFMTIHPLRRRGRRSAECVSFGLGDFDGNLDEVELTMPASLFARCIFSLNDTRERVNIRGHGSIKMDERDDSLAIYTTSCGQHYRFSLEDLVILAELV